jgi:alpha-ketoglutarate-dependent taurine dioxygenase
MEEIMGLNFSEITPSVGLRVEGLRLDQPLTPDEIATLREKMHTFGLLLFEDQDLDEDKQLRFSRYFGKSSRQGPIQKSLATGASYVSNKRADGAFGKGELGFHSDQAYYQYPMKAICLYGMEVPSNGGETLFSNTAYVLSKMPPDLYRKLSTMEVRHTQDFATLDYGEAKQKEVSADRVEYVHPVIAKHPWSDAEILMLNPLTARNIVGMTAEESRPIIDEVHARVADPDVVYRHSWKPGQVLIWDNLLLQHARSPFDDAETRTLRRCGIAHELDPA